jgi:3-deoxy-D-manno-octulosonate 8-phosphate phosphatase (KDO 8-P phosphatase)
MPFDAQQLVSLRAIAFDVDGVLTDGTLLWSTAGEESKQFFYADIMAISLLRRLGIGMALISGEPSLLVDRFAEKMHIGFVAKGTRDKASALRDFTIYSGIALQRICFFGDDVNDLSAMAIAGLCACPSNATAEVLEFVAKHGYLSPSPGGRGAVRSLADAILAARKVRGQDVYQLPLPE